MPAMIPVRVRAVETLHPTLRRVVLEPVVAGAFPAAAPGSHVVVEMRHDGQVVRRPYSLVAGGRDAYQLIVRRVARSRGGSAYIHDHLVPGTALRLSPPATLFMPSPLARHHLMLAGGIGVTPFLSFLPALATRSHALHLRCRADELPAFTRLLAPWERARVHPGPFDVAALLEAQPVGTHLYVCGPDGFMDHVTAAATALGWPASRLHTEHFGAASGRPFTAMLARAGRTVEVGADISLLDAIEAAGIEVPYLCRGGACGQCRLTVLGGTPDHRDHVLTPAERNAGEAIMPCVSRALSDRLVLDL